MMKRTKRKQEKARNDQKRGTSPEKEGGGSPSPSDEGEQHREKFEQLLDDAVFGVRSK